MKRGTLFCPNWFWAFLIVPLALLLPLLALQWHPIEQDVVNNARSALSTNDSAWAELETYNRGRDVLITGKPSDQESIDRARTAVAQAYGVNKVEITAEVVVPPASPELDVTVTGTSVVLRGILKDQAAIDEVLDKAISLFGADNVDNQLTVGDNTSSLPRLGDFFAALAGSTVGLNPLSASVSNGTVLLQGQVATLDSKKRIAAAMRQIFSGTVTNELTIAAPPPVKRESCEDLLNQLLSEGSIKFDTGNATIKSDSHPLLDGISAAAQRCPDAVFEVAGHTDSTGNTDFNMRLSERRAQAVVDYLVGSGLPKERFDAAGYGPNEPVADNNTEAGRAQNRRIEFRLKD